jgi:ubiquinone/menaquinone biosynthesis C-methylase UbiE
VAGIPDLRIAPDLWIGMEEDRAKGLAVDATAEPGFEAAVRRYWELTPGTSSARAKSHIDHVLRAESRTREWLERWPSPPRPNECWLDLGCGTADLACAAPPGVCITGLDVAFRWLLIARRRLAQCGRSAELVCGNAEALPFSDASFDRVIALGTLEHCADPGRVLGEARRVLRSGGTLRLRTVNRYSALPEPHVGVWGVGYLPRRWADPYVRWRTGHRYLHRLLGPGELGRRLRDAGFRTVRVEAAHPLRTEVERQPAPLRATAGIYARLRGAPVAGVMVRWVAPVLEAEASAA